MGAEAANGTSRRGVLDDEIVTRYWALLSSSESLARLKVLRCDRSSAELIDCTASAALAAGQRPPLVWQCQMSNRNTGLVTLLDAATSGSYSQWVTALRNPGIAEHIERLWGHPGIRGIRRPALLANPAAPSAFLAEHWEVNLPVVSMNPAAAPELLTELLTAHRAVVWPAILENPGIDEEHLNEGLASDNWEVRESAVKNPRLGIEALTEALNTELHLGRDSWIVALLRSRLQAADPKPALTCTTSELRQRHLDDAAAAAVAELSHDAYGAALALTRSGFRGPLSELLELAATFA